MNPAALLKSRASVSFCLHLSLSLHHHHLPFTHINMDKFKEVSCRLHPPLCSSHLPLCLSVCLSAVSPSVSSAPPVARSFSAISSPLGGTGTFFPFVERRRQATNPRPRCKPRHHTLRSATALRLATAASRMDLQDDRHLDLACPLGRSLDVGNQKPHFSAALVFIASDPTAEKEREIAC